MRFFTPLLLKLGLYHPLRRFYFKARNRGASPQSVFTEIHRQNRWGSGESRSGEGSTLAQTGTLRHALPSLFDRHGIRSLLDIPCGDFHWMSRVPLVDIAYTGADIVEAIVSDNASRYSTGQRRFMVADLCSNTLAKVDLVFCRDCMVHLPFGMLAVIENIRASGSTLLLATTFPSTEINREIEIGDFRPINLQRAPFNFSPPIEIIDEHCTEANGKHADKMMGLWRISELPRVSLS
ncbi:MAG: class I SAM-dependent methyltransferase [Rhodanobacteraceae bacterium]|nr:class I SAM-dependent methyltransferase [Rhodanobacteraceae bacterium]